MHEIKYSLQNPDYLNGKDAAVIDFYGEEWSETIKIHLDNAVFEMQNFLYEAAGDIPIVIDYDDNYEIALSHPLDGPAQKLIEELFIMQARQLYDEICKIEEELYNYGKKEFADNESAEKTIKNYHTQIGAVNKSRAISYAYLTQAQLDDVRLKMDASHGL